MRIARTRQIAFDPSSAEIPAVFFALGLAFLHIGFGAGATGYAMLAAMFVPVAWGTAAAGSRGGYLASVAALAALTPDAIAGNIWAIAGQLLLLAAFAPLGMYLGLSIRREERDIASTQALVRQRLARLKAEPGYWHEVATSRMGAHITAIEARFIRESLESKQPGVVLDAGAGSGRLEFALREHATHIIATELDRDELARMEDDARVTPVAVGTHPSLPVRDRTLDWIVAIEIPAVTEEPWFASECARTLAADGRIVLMVYNGASYKGLIGRLLGRVRAAHGVRWAQLYYRHALSEHLQFWQMAGFVPSRKMAFHWSPLPRNSNSPLIAAGSAIERMIGLRRLTAFSPWVLLELRRAR